MKKREVRLERLKGQGLLSISHLNEVLESFYLPPASLPPFTEWPVQAEMQAEPWQCTQF